LVCFLSSGTGDGDYKAGDGLDQVSFEGASELAYFGVQILHPIAMQPAMKYNVPVQDKNSYNPLAVGTIIKQEKLDQDRLVHS
jgi:aspartate kinase